MINSKSLIRAATGIALLAGVALVSACGPAPYSHAVTSEQTTTTIPAPLVSTTTTTTERSSQRN
jgi:hypothetical protein